jgi:predicted phage baseplate assembly protein
VNVSSTADDILLGTRDLTDRYMWTLMLDVLPDPFTLDDFPEAKPTVTVYGNVADATQGKAEKQAIVGSGDGRQDFQTFKIPKAPLTYFAIAGNTPPETPELLVYVDDILWKRVPSLFAHGPKEMIYIVREDADGTSWIQFGDGDTGARLPSGVNNVVVQWRTGVNAFGALQDGTTPQAGAKLDRLDKVRLPGIIAGGAAPETGGHARETAPGRIQSLDRLVSLRDYETETMAIAGIERAAAAWQINDGVPMVVLTVLMQSGRESEMDSVRDIITVANRCRGPRRFPVVANEGHLRYTFLAVQVTIDPSRRDDLMRTAIIAALLGAPDDALGDPQPGLFTPEARQFGDPEYATRIEGVIQDVPGVVWTAVTGFGMLPPGDDPSLLATPAQPWTRVETITPDAGEILTLAAAHLILTTAAEVVTGSCT